MSDGGLGLCHFSFFKHDNTTLAFQMWNTSFVVVEFPLAVSSMQFLF